MEKKNVIEMTIEELQAEIESIEKMEKKLIDFSVYARAEELVDELNYKKFFEKKGYTRFQAGYLSTFM